MSGLSNHFLREKSMKKFLEAMEFDITKISLFNFDEFFVFDFDNATQTDKFADKLNTVIIGGSKGEVKSLKLEDIIADEIKKATASDSENFAIHQSSCESILNNFRNRGLILFFRKKLVYSS